MNLNLDVKLICNSVFSLGVVAGMILALKGFLSYGFVIIFLCLIFELLVNFTKIIYDR